MEAIENHSKKISSLKIFDHINSIDRRKPGLEKKTSETVAEQRRDFKVIVGATFTAELVEPILRYWMEKVKLKIDIQFAPYNQVFQELLEPVVFFTGANMVLI